MNVLFFSPGFPAEMPHFTRGLAEVGARVIGLGDQPAEALPDVARRHLAAYVRVETLWKRDSLLQALHDQVPGVVIDRVECLWEPGMIVAAELREALDVPGMTVAETVPFRDKGKMKEVLDGAGIRTPRHRRATTAAGCREAAEEIGFPLIVKPIAGAGSADTYRVESEAELEAILPAIRHVDEVSVEEFIDGEELTFDTICHDGEILYHNVAWYRPRPLVARSLQWISPQTISLRDVGRTELKGGVEMGKRVLKALGFRTGFTHMEWFRKADGEAVFGEIGGRPPGARSVDIMNYACDLDVFRGWAEAATRGTFSQPIERKYNAAVIFKRAEGEGRIASIQGLDSLLARYGPHVVAVDLLPLGAPRRNWKQTLLSDGSVVLRHPNLERTMAMADDFGTDLRLYAG